MLKFLLWIAATVFVIYTSYWIIKKTITSAVKVFPIPYKLVPTYEIFYSLTILVFCCVSAYTVLRPGSMVSYSLDALEARITQTDWIAVARSPVDSLSIEYAKVRQQLRNLEIGIRIWRFGSSIGVRIGSAWGKVAGFGADIWQTISNSFTRILASFKEGDTSSVTSRSNIKTTLPEEFICIANPGARYTAVLLRNEPSWNSVEATRVSVDRGTEIKFTSRLENQEGTWFVIDSPTDMTRYVSAKICSASSDLNMIPTVLPD